MTYFGSGHHDEVPCRGRAFYPGCCEYHSAEHADALARLSVPCELGRAAARAEDARMEKRRAEREADPEHQRREAERQAAEARCQRELDEAYRAAYARAEEDRRRRESASAPNAKLPAKGAPERGGDRTPSPTPAGRPALSSNPERGHRRARLTPERAVVPSRGTSRTRPLDQLTAPAMGGAYPPVAGAP